MDISSDGRTLYPDRTAFYPTSGGQPHDLGQIGGVAVVEAIDEGEPSRIAWPRQLAQGRWPVRSTGIAAGITCGSTPGSTCSRQCFTSAWA